ncbi:MAG: murein L,D-transpeptidase catalytic domain family protein [Bacteroidota bacterium]
MIRTILIIFNCILSFVKLGEAPVIQHKLIVEDNLDHSKTITSNHDSVTSPAIAMGKSGYEKLKKNARLIDILLVVDFTQPSHEKRMYILDMSSDRLVHTSHVAHGKNSGLIYATKFSNEKNTNCSSLGFYRTAETYFGKHGLSLRLDGLEEGINDNARQRAIVIHSAKYASQSFIKKYGRLGRSFGCPSLPEDDYKETIDLIKGGALLFIYYPDPEYFKGSKIINSS